MKRVRKRKTNLLVKVFWKRKWKGSVSRRLTAPSEVFTISFVSLSIIIVFPTEWVVEISAPVIGWGTTANPTTHSIIVKSFFAESLWENRKIN